MRSLLALVALPLLSTGCATVAGTAVSPITGGVDLVRYHRDRGGSRLWTPFVALGGAIGGPFAAVWNGVRHDGLNLYREGYFTRMPAVFRPYETLGREHAVWEPRPAPPSPEEDEPPRPEPPCCPEAPATEPAATERREVGHAAPAERADVGISERPHGTPPR